MNTDPSLRSNFQPTPLPSYESSFGHRLPTEAVANRDAEQRWVHGQFVDFANNVQGHYDTQQPVENLPPTLAMDYDITTHPAQAMQTGTFAQHTGTRAVSRYADGARRTVTTFDDGTVRTMFELPTAAIGPNGGPVVFTANQTPDHTETYEMRLLAPSAHDAIEPGSSEAEIYRWSQDQPVVSRVPGGQGGWGEARPANPRDLMREESDEYGIPVAIWSIPGYIQNQWRLETKRQPIGLIRRWRAVVAAGTAAVDRFMEKRFPTGSM